MESDTSRIGKQLAAVARPAVDMVARKIQESRDANEDFVCTAEALEMVALIAELAKVGLDSLEAGTAELQGPITIQGTTAAAEMRPPDS